MKYTYKKMAGGGSVKSEKGYTAKDRKAIRSLIEEVADPHSVDVTGGSSVTVIKKSKKRMPGGGLVSGPTRSQPPSTGKSGGRGPGSMGSKIASGASSALGAAKGSMRYAAGGMVESSKTGPAGIPNYTGKARPAPRNPMPQRNKIRSAPGVYSPIGERGRGMAAGGMVDIGRKMAENYNRSGVFGQPVVKKAAAGSDSENGMVKMGRRMAKTYHRTGTFGTPRNMAAGGIVGRPARSYRDMKAGAGSGVGRLQKTKIARGR